MDDATLDVISRTMGFTTTLRARVESGEIVMLEDTQEQLKRIDDDLVRTFGREHMRGGMEARAAGHVNPERQRKWNEDLADFMWDELMHGESENIG